MSEVSVNDPHQPPAQPERTPCVPEGRRFADEDRAWTQLYCAVLQGNPSTAEEVIEALDADPQSKHSRLALYTQAKTALRKHEAAEARKQRIAAFLRTALTMPVLGPIRLLHSMLSTSADVAVDMLPPARREPARKTMHRRGELRVMETA